MLAFHLAFYLTLIMTSHWTFWQSILFCPSFWHSVGHTFWHSFPDVLTFYLASTLTFSLVLTGILLLIRLAYTLAWARVRRVKLHPEMEGEMKTTNR